MNITITMEIPKFTAGPWKFDVGNIQIESFKTRQPICYIAEKWDLTTKSDLISYNEMIANAHLISAAPDMLYDAIRILTKD